MDPTILIVDDDEGTRLSVHRAVCDANARPVLASSGIEALRCAKSYRFDAGFVDLRLPDTNGIAVGEQLRALDNSIALVLITGWASTRSTVQALRAGFFDVLEKPLSLDDTEAAVRTVISLRSRPVRGVPPSIEHVLRRWRAALGEVKDVQDRLIWLIYSGVCADSDIRTIPRWARAAGVSTTSLCEICRLAGVRPQAVKHFTRVLRAVLLATTEHTSISMWLDVCDQRTANNLRARAGLDLDALAAPSVDCYLARQAFLPALHPALERLRILIAAAGNDGASK
jgi:ActR/RegA family two-component response regulator